jgi:hypothetical protein
MKVDFKIDASKLTSITKGELSKQARFAAAKTLTGAAFDARQKIQRYLPIWLDMKTRLLERSVIVERARPNKLKAVVGFHKRTTLAGLLKKGGTRHPKGRAIAVPVRARNKTGRITRSRTVKALLAKPNTFSAEINGVGGVWQRDRRTNRITLLYAYENTTHYDKKTIRFHGTVKVHAPKYIWRNLWKNLEYALVTKKR